MITITLPDNSKKQFDQPVTIYDIATDISPGLAKAALAGNVNGRLVDTSYRVQHDAAIRIITERDAEGLEVLRHSCAHLLAQAVKQLYPQAQVTIGPVIEDGFYYDFAYEPGFTLDDLPKIEKKMQELAKANLTVIRSEMPRDEAIIYFEKLGEHYKADIIREIPAGEVITLYKQGDFTDLCRGPHLPNTGKIKAFKLMKVAGAYWRGDAKNAMLQRIYGTAWPDKKSLQAYLTRLEEAEKRDHRRLGKALDLFHMQTEAPGMIFWHAKGWVTYQIVKHYIRDLLSEQDYQEINTPQLVDHSLWEKSGHAEKFGNEMFTLEAEERKFALKPMNCPCHVQVFNQGLKSYRDLPLRLAEFGSCHRNELSGTLHGLFRVRHMVQDDAHIFCEPNDIQSEVAKLISLLLKTYKDFGFNNLLIKLATRPEERIGSNELWDKAEKDLATALDQHNLPWEESPGEGAFYGPKIEFSLTDCLGRVWQCGTIQIDYFLPGRLGASYIDKDGNKQTPIMIHRAILGSIERFMGILIEHHAGALPVWLTPVQAVILNITDDHADYTKTVAAQLRKQGVRIETDLRNEKIGFKIREHTLQKVPYLLVVGDREVQNQAVAVRGRGNQDLGAMSLEEFRKLIESQCEHKN